MEQSQKNVMMFGLKPFDIDPVIFSFLRKKKVTAPVFMALYLLFVMLSLLSVTGLSNMLFGSYTQFDFQKVGLDYLLFRENLNIYEMPLILDFPGIGTILTATLATCTVYSLLWDAQYLHQDLLKNGCICYNKGQDTYFITQVMKINRRFKFIGKFWPIAIIGSIGLSWLFFSGQDKGLYGFLGSNALFENWWASIRPFRPGSVILLIVGSLGIYSVYIEAVLGLSYVRFLKICKKNLYFSANIYNPDGYFGWKRLRRIIYNLEVGLILTALITLFLSYFVAPVGLIAGLLVLVVFDFIVLYVFVSVTNGFKRQADENKRKTIKLIMQQIQTCNNATNITEKMLVIPEYEKLKLAHQIPIPPIKQSWLIIGFASIILPLGTFVLQLLQYVSMKP